MLRRATLTILTTAVALLVLVNTRPFGFQLPWQEEQSRAEAICIGLFLSPLCNLIPFATRIIPEARDDAISPLRELYMNRLNSWAADGGNIYLFREQVGETCAKLVLVSATPEEAASFTLSFLGPSESETREEFNFRVDVCQKLTAHRVYPQPEFSNPKIVRYVCRGWLDIFSEMCEAAQIR